MVDRSVARMKEHPMQQPVSLFTLAFLMWILLEKANLA